RLGMQAIREDVLFGAPVIVHAGARERWSDARPEPIQVIEGLLDRVAAWAHAQPDLAALALVGSRARGTARAESDLDLVFLTRDPERYVRDESWAQELGAASVQATAHRGALVEQRLKLVWGPELDVGVGSPRWASVAPLDPGTERVTREGLRIVYDPERILDQLQQAVRARSGSP